jgi:hypothetical protein
MKALPVKTVLRMVRLPAKPGAWIASAAVVSLGGEGLAESRVFGRPGSWEGCWFRSGQVC